MLWELGNTRGDPESQTQLSIRYRLGCKAFTPPASTHNERYNRFYGCSRISLVFISSPCPHPCNTYKREGSWPWYFFQELTLHNQVNTAGRLAAGSFLAHKSPGIYYFKGSIFNASNVIPSTWKIDIPPDALPLHGWSTWWRNFFASQVPFKTFTNLEFPYYKKRCPCDDMTTMNVMKPRWLGKHDKHTCNCFQRFHLGSSSGQ